MSIESTEMYLLTVYRLTLKVSCTSVSDIAAMLDISLSSVSEKVKHLAEQGYLIHEWREGVLLTDMGHHIAIKMLRKRRLIETFLVEMADYHIDEVHEEACRLEHVISDRLADRIEEFLKYPRVDPHGHPIPTRNGNIIILNYQSLANVSPTRVVVIQRLDNMDEKRLRYLRELGLVPGTRVLVLEAPPFDGPLTLKVGGKTIAVARAIAHYIGVTTVTEDHEHEKNEKGNS